MLHQICKPPNDIVGKNTAITNETATILRLGLCIHFSVALDLGY